MLFIVFVTTETVLALPLVSNQIYSSASTVPLLLPPSRFLAIFVTMCDEILHTLKGSSADCNLGVGVQHR